MVLATTTRKIGSLERKSLAMVSQDNLTKPIVVSTKVPCPPDSNTLDVKPASGDGSTQATIELRACSEFTEYAASVQYFNSGSKL